MQPLNNRTTRRLSDGQAALVFLAPATHPWPGGATSWYYDLTTIPVIGRLFSETLTYPAGTLQMADATTCVFAPNKVPDNYLGMAAIPLVLRPSAFRANATDVAGLYSRPSHGFPRQFISWRLASKHRRIWRAGSAGKRSWDAHS